MGNDFEFYTSNRFIPYPFAEQVDAGGLHEVFVDALLYHNQDLSQRLRVAALDLDDETITLTLEDGTPFAALLAAEKSPVRFFGAYRIHEWIRSSTKPNDLTELDLVVRLVSFAEAEDATAFPVVPAAGEAVIQSSLVYRQPNRVRRIQVQSAGGAPLMTSGGKQIIVQPGFNMSIQVAEPEDNLGFELLNQVQPLRQSSEILMAAIPGAGAGGFPTCAEENPPIFTINDIAPNQYGEFQFEGQDCYWWERPLDGPRVPVIDAIIDAISTTRQHALQLHNQCEECCACEDFVDTYDAMRTIFERAEEAADLLNTVLRRYLEVREDFINLKLERENGLQINLQLLTFPQHQLAIQVIVFNNSCEPLEKDVSLEFNFSSAPIEIVGQPVEEAGVLNTDELQEQHVDLEGTWPEFTIDLPATNLGAARFLSYRFGVRFLDPAEDFPRGDTSVTLQVKASTDEAEAEAVDTVQLVNPLELE
jgi:hypothetical protein